MSPDPDEDGPGPDGARRAASFAFVAWTAVALTALLLVAHVALDFRLPPIVLAVQLPPPVAFGAARGVGIGWPPRRPRRRRRLCRPPRGRAAR